MVAGLKARSYEEKLKELGLTTLEERRHQLDMVQVYKIVKGVGGVNGEHWFKTADCERETRRTEPSIQAGIKKKFLLPAGTSCLEQCTE